MVQQEKELRFNVGDRVSCKGHSESESEWWLLGTVVKLLPQCENFSYQVRLEHGEDDTRIHRIAVDDDFFIKMATKEDNVRFKVGDRVACNCGEWKHGTVVELWWYDNQDGVTHPYQVALDEHEDEIFAPFDMDSCIQKSIPEFDPTITPTIDPEGEDSIGVTLLELQINAEDLQAEIDDNLAKYANTLRDLGFNDEGMAKFLSNDFRFKVGDRVQCKYGPDDWQHGVVIKLWYEEYGCIYPYQVRLDRNKALIRAPIDRDDVIKLSELSSPVGLFVEEGDPLFADPVMKEDDCPICFQPLPRGAHVYKRCCGKEICCGCSHAMVTVRDDDRCPFCRVPIETSDEEILLSLKKRIDLKDPIAAEVLSGYYEEGEYGLQIDCEKSFELLTLAESFGSTKVYCPIGCAHWNGMGTKCDKDKAKHYFQLAAMQGDRSARESLANVEQDEGNPWKSYKHHVIAARFGLDEAMTKVKRGYSDGFVSEEELLATLRSFQKAQIENSSSNRAKAAQEKAYNSRIPDE